MFEDPSLVIFTVATAETDGFRRFSHAARKLDLDVRVLGSGVEWEGGDVRRFPGGGQKILFLKEALEPLKDRENLLILFTDRYGKVAQKFLKLTSKIFFGLEEKLRICLIETFFHFETPKYQILN